MKIPNDYKKNIEEIIMLYKLEGNVKDLYVEGKSDKHFLECHLQQLGITHLGIYVIGDIFIPPEKLFEERYEDGNRDRIIFLIKRLNNDQCLGKYKGIIDRDILYFTRGLPFVDNLLTTDYSCFEMYAYNRDVMMKINDTGFSHRIPENIISFIDRVLILVSSVRIFEKRGNESITKPELKKYICYRNNSFDFEEGKYLTMIYTKNAIGLSYDDFLLEIDIISGEISDKDIREFSNGHDFISIFHCLLKELGVFSQHITDDIVRAMTMIAIDTEYLKTCELFKALINFSRDV